MQDDDRVTALQGLDKLRSIYERQADRITALEAGLKELENKRKFWRAQAMNNVERFFKNGWDEGLEWALSVIEDHPDAAAYLSRKMAEENAKDEAAAHALLSSK